MGAPRVLVLHNRYRIGGGEERAVELQVRALQQAGVAHRLLERRSAGLGRVKAGVAMLRGGASSLDVASAVRDLRADVVHAHNIQPLIGPNALAAARDAGAKVVLNLHNARLFCAIGVASRDGLPCHRCRHRLTLPGLALNCRHSMPEAVVYAAALSLYQPVVWKAVDCFVTPSRYAAGQLALLGVPADRLEVVPHYLPADAIAAESRADQGRYALTATRLSEEKGIDIAIEAAARARIPLRIAGEGPASAMLTALAHRLGAPVEFLGGVDRKGLAELVGNAAMVLLPSRYQEFGPFAALEAMAAGVPVVASRLGGLPEIVGEASCVPPFDVDAFAARMRTLWEDAEFRRARGDALLARAREGHAEDRYVRDLLDLYARLTYA